MSCFSEPLQVQMHSFHRVSLIVLDYSYSILFHKQIRGLKKTSIVHQKAQYLFSVKTSGLANDLSVCAAAGTLHFPHCGITNKFIHSFIRMKSVSQAVFVRHLPLTSKADVFENEQASIFSRDGSYHHFRMHEVESKTEP